MNPAAQGPETLLGRTLGGYRLNRLIGVGGTGAVFLALSPDGDATEPAPAPPAEVVVKVLIVPWQLTDEERADFQTRFEREAGILGRLHHPHIASILGYGDEDNLPYMVLPYFGGGSLATRLAAVTGGLSLEEAFSILNQIAGALDYIHHQGILHRDVKPGNILFDGAGVAYLSDFGIASVLDRPSTAVTATGQIIGTPAYMAPEQVQGAKSGVPSDIYGLGSVLYTMLTGHAPFEGTSLTAILVSKLQDEPPDPRALRPELPEPAAACVLKALARDPNQRFATAGDFVQAFGAGLQDIWAPGVDPIGILLPPPGTVARSAPWTALP
ncbi:MAG TPA: serine/threonine-protein kinase, partial [Ktedonobacterales bacterium]|nr:serine/threonine-protein kinase [Ktedonobacterales bacterium]